MPFAAVIASSISLAAVVAITAVTWSGPFKQTRPQVLSGTASCSQTSSTIMACKLSRPLKKNASIILGPLTVK